METASVKEMFDSDAGKYLAAYEEPSQLRSFIFQERRRIVFELLGEPATGCWMWAAGRRFTPMSCSGWGALSTEWTSRRRRKYAPRYWHPRVLEGVLARHGLQVEQRRFHIFRLTFLNQISPKFSLWIMRKMNSVSSRFLGANLAILARKRGGELGSHSLTHRNLAQLDDADLREEVRDSRERVQEATGHRVEAFSYPYGNAGSFTLATEKAVREAGYTQAYVNQMRPDNSDRQPFRIRRIRVYPPDTGSRFQRKMAGAYNWVDRLLASRARFP